LYDLRGPWRGLPRRPVLDPVLTLFLLFLQEIISGRDRLCRRNPGVPSLRLSQEQRAGLP
jgi:hypothetical protein